MMIPTQQGGVAAGPTGATMPAYSNMPNMQQQQPGTTAAQGMPFL
jgi:hypothetical protein